MKAIHNENGHDACVPQAYTMKTEVLFLYYVRSGPEQPTVTEGSDEPFQLVNGVT